MKTFKKTMVRDTPVIMVEAWSDAFTETLTSLSGFKWPEPVFIYNGDSVESWRPTREFHTVLSVKLSRWAKKRNNLQKFLKQIDFYPGAYGHIKKSLSNVKSTTSLNVLRKIVRIRESFLLGCSGFLAGYWAVEWNDISIKKGEGPIFASVIIKKIEKYRKTDAILDDSSSAVYGYLNLIATNEGWPARFVFLMTLNELENALKNNRQPDFRELKKRAEAYAYFNKKVFVGRSIEAGLKKSRYILKGRYFKPKASNLLKGVGAGEGKTSGYVVKIFNREQMSKIKKGSILVAPMTTPWYLPAMKKAGAFVTDEGGVICHAAIIAREMKKPCVVGTKVATKVLKDGDMVEVNANRGWVRKIS